MTLQRSDRPGLDTRLTIAMAAVALGTAGAGATARGLGLGGWPASAAAAAVGVGLALLAARLTARPLAARMRALGTAVAGLGDGDFAISVARGGGREMDQLIESFNRAGAALRAERQSLHQRELLLDTVIQATPLAMVLLDPRERIVYGNTAARQLLGRGRRLEGAAWETLVGDQTPEARAHLRADQDGLFAVDDEEGERQVYLLSQKTFRLNSRSHRLILLQQLTRELNRQEVATWKKVIRVISHELNNSVAPISSLAHSGARFAAAGDLDKLDRALRSITDRARHLAGFIERYARFARIPEPRLEPVAWADFIAGLRSGALGFRQVGPLPQRPGRFDRALLEQVMLNLLTNAHEAAGSTGPAVEVTVREGTTGFWIEVLDRGPGMQPQTLSQALVPFYSTKPQGSGIGLALCREIVEAHDGRLSLRNRDGGGLRVRIHLPG